MTTTPRVSIEEKDDRIILDYEFPDFELSEPEYFPILKKKYRHVRIDGTGALMHGGKPRLPSLGRYVQIPFGCDYEIGDPETAEPKKVPGVNVAPAQSNLIDTGTKPVKIECDDKTYGSAGPYPKDLVEVHGPFVVDGYNSLLVHVCPFKYLPKTSTLEAYPKVRVVVKLKKKEAGSDVPSTPGSEGDLEAFGNLFVNPVPYSSSGRDWTPPENDPPSPLPEDPEFRILYQPDLKDAAERLAMWKNMCGVRTTTTSIDEVGNTPDDIKQFIRARRRAVAVGPVFHRPRLRYVLLLGDAPGPISSERVQSDAYVTTEPNRTDYYYSTDRDPQSPTDLVFPWLSIGRIPARTVKEAEGIVDQIIRYERFPPERPGYYHSVVLAAGFATFMGAPCQSLHNHLQTMERIRERLSDTEVNVERVYASDDPASRGCPLLINPVEPDAEPLSQAVAQSLLREEFATAKLIEAFEQGRLVIAHRGHATIDGLDVPKLDRNTVKGLGSDAQSILLSVNCASGWFDAPRPVESFAEVLLRIPGGSPAVIAACRESNSDLNDYLIMALFDALWGGVLPTYPDDSTASYPVRRHRLGDILNYAKAYLPIAFGHPQFVKDHFEIYHLLGDPTLEVWRRPPSVIKLIARIRSIRGFGVRLDVTMSSCPNGSTVTIWRGGKMIKRVEPHSPAFSIGARDLLGYGSEEITLCFKAPGYRFAETTAVRT